MDCNDAFRIETLQYSPQQTSNNGTTNGNLNNSNNNNNINGNSSNNSANNNNNNNNANKALNNLLTQEAIEEFNNLQHGNVTLINYTHSSNPSSSSPSSISLQTLTNPSHFINGTSGNNSNNNGHQSKRHKHDNNTGGGGGSSSSNNGNNNNINQLINLEQQQKQQEQQALNEQLASIEQQQQLISLGQNHHDSYSSNQHVNSQSYIPMHHLQLTTKQAEILKESTTTVSYPEIFEQSQPLLTVSLKYIDHQLLEIIKFFCFCLAICLL